MKGLLPITAVGLGIFLVLLGFVWGMIFPATNTWTEEKSQRMTELRSKTHQLMFQASAAKERPNMVGGRSAAEVQAEYEAAQAEFKDLSAEFQSARDAPNTVAGYLRWTGIAVTLMGGVLSLALRGNA